MDGSNAGTAPVGTRARSEEARGAKIEVIEAKDEDTPETGLG